MRLLLLSVFLLGACGGTSPAAECRKTSGAMWECDSAGKNCRCAEPVSDGGVRCFDSSTCQARCIFISGSCEGDPNNPPQGACQSNDAKYGCFQVLKTVTDPSTGIQSAVCESSCP